MSRKSPLVSLAVFALLAITAFAQNIVITPNTTVFNPAGGTLTYTATITYDATPSVLAFSATLPAGWTYLSGTNEPPVKPSTGTTGALGWAYTTTVPESPTTFTFTATYPANLTGLQPLSTSVVTRAEVEAPPVTTPGPTVTLAAPPTAFTWAGDSETHSGLWTDTNKWTPTGTVPNNNGLSTYSAEVSLGTATISTGTTITLNDLFLSGGTIDGGGALTLVGTSSNWSAGALTGLSPLTIATDATFAASTYAQHNFDQTTIVNQGTFNWQQGGALRSGNGGSIINASGATFHDASSGVAADYLITNGFGGTFSFSNAGSYVKSTVGSTTRIEVPFTNSGNVRIDGGVLRFTSTYAQPGGQFRVGTGTTAVFDNDVTFSAGSVIGTGTITGNVTIGTTVNAEVPPPGKSPLEASPSNGATLSPGDTLGQLTIQGNLTLLNTSKLLFDIGGTNQGVDHDFLSVSGNAALGGSLALTLQNGFSSSASAATTFTLLTSSGLTGTFLNAPNGMRFWATDEYSSFIVTYTPTSVTLSNFQFVSIPEPSTWALLITGLGAIALSVWRRRP